MAVPGSPKSRVSEGTNRLIQDGAYLVTSARDVLSFLRHEGECVPEGAESGLPRERALTLEEGAVLSEVERAPQTADQIVERLGGLTPGKVAALLSSLEVKGIVAKVAGGKYLAKT
jgi:DNA processing protein